MGTAHRWNGSGQLLTSLIGFIALLQLLVVETDAFTRRSTTTTSTFLSRNTQQHSWFIDNMLTIRGGDADVNVDIGDIESSDEEEEDEEEEEKFDPKLAKAAQAATSKVKARTAKIATNAAKAAVAASLSSNKPQKNNSKSSGLSKFFKIPYIIKATLNPFTFIQMTVEYWKSFVNPTYLDDKKDQSQDLRSGLQEKAKKSGGKPSTRGKRKMKPGQAKTLSDLPQLNT
jgi:hypothetical protein